MEPVATSQGRVGRFTITPSQALVGWFGGVTLLGTLLLSLPFAAVPGHQLSLIDALFTAASAVSVTGLTVTDISTELRLPGQLVVLVLLQLGGLGYMVLSTIVVILAGQKIGIKQRLVMQEALHVLSTEGLIHLLRGILILTLVVQGSGAVLLALRFAADMPWLKAVYFGIFHAVSAFNTAGFTLFSNGLVDYRDDPTINVVVTSLILIGGIGFVVYRDLYRYVRRQTYRLSIHTLMVLTITAGLTLVGTVLFWVLEHRNPATLAELSLGQQATVAFFHAAGSRVAGFATVDVGAATGAGLYLLILLMFIGASPTGTGGGIKTTTFGTMLIGLWAGIRGQSDVIVFHRRMPQELVVRAFSVAMLAFLLTTVVTMLLQISEGADFLSTLFEVTSAFGTAGLSTGDGGVLSYSAHFSDFGKLMIAATMFVGRVGPLTVGVALVRRGEEYRRVRFPEERVLIG